MGKRARTRGRLARMRESGAASSSPALMRPGDVADTSNAGADSTGTSGDGDEDDHTCPTCGGSAVVNGDICGTCNGSGSVQDSSDVQDMGEAADAKTKTCPTCHGTGKILGGNVTCKTCNGTGKVPIDWKPPAKSDGNPFAKSKESDAGPSMDERFARLEEKLDAIASQNAQLREAHPDHLNAQFSGMARVKNKHGEDGYAVTLIREGLGNPADDAWYTGDAINELVESKRAEGMQAYANHPDAMEEANRPERDIRHLIGKHTDVSYAKEAGGKATATAVFVPLTTDERHPQLGWVTTLAEAAARNRGDQPLCGWSLFGLSAGDEGTRPDGTTGRMVNLILPQSGDLVTNAGAGGGFARRLMQESARRLRRAVNPNREDTAMNIADFRKDMAEALKQLREASTDEQRTTANAEIERLQEEAGKIDKPLQVPDSVEALTEAAPALAAKMREAVKAEGADEVARLREENVTLKARNEEAAARFDEIGTIRKISEAVRSALPKEASDDEHRRFVNMAQTARLTEAVDIKDMVDTDLRVMKAREDAILSKVRESLGELDLPDVEGMFGHVPDTGQQEDDGGLAFLREAGVAVRTPAAA